MVMDVRARLARLRLPVIAAPMFLVSGPDLVVACCKAGVVGSFPTPNVRTVEELDTWIAKIGQALGPEDAPWAMNLVTHSTNKRLPLDLERVARARPPIVITALGSPAPAVQAVHAYGGLVLADVNSLFYARKAVDAGADGLVLVSAGAGGHTGHLSNLVFVEEVRRFFSGLVVLAGAIGSGRAVLAAQVLGADLAYVGTGFIAAEESLAEPAYKQMLVDSTADDLIVTKAFTGANASMLKPSILAQGLDPAEIATRTAKMNFTGLEGAEVKAWKGIWSAGQGVGAVTAIEPAAAIVDRLAREYAAAKAEAARLLA
ncbi:MAG: nitronate monooxygenase family protein [Thalassobaculales bacterium]